MSRLTAPWLTASAGEFCELLENAGYKALFVGGCVRNSLLGLDAADLDLATDALPEAVSQLARDAGHKVIPTGIEHGTVTVMIDGTPIEATTFRRDVSTDGRRATVSFSDDVTEDARRRDFTVNALYADARGAITDPLNGLPDLKARHIRFIGDPCARIAEDYLRILRFFRFTAWYGDPALGIDAEGLAACAALGEGLAQVSCERITQELLKLLAAPNPAPATASMSACGVLHHVLPGADAPTLTRLASADPLTRLAALGGERNRLRLSRAEERRLGTLLESAASLDSAATLGYRIGAQDALAAIQLRAAQLERPAPQNAASEAHHGARQSFPIKAADLMPALTGKALGERLKELEAHWIASEFALSREALLRQTR